MKVLVFGGSGMLGTDVQAVLERGFHVFCPSHSEIDILDQHRVDQCVADFDPDVIINCAAYTDVERAEDHPEDVWRLNSDAVSNLARAACKCDTRLVHMSTDYVFDGVNREYLAEDAPCRPLSIYGKTKRAGELACLTLLPERTLVVRTSWLFGGRGPNFVSTMLRLSAQKERLEVVADQFGSPTYTLDLANCLKHLLGYPEVSGIIHVSNQGTCSWHHFAEAIITGWAALGNDVVTKDVVPIPSSEWPSKAPRPSWSSFSMSKLEEEADYRMSSWEIALSDYLSFRSSDDEYQR